MTELVLDQEIWVSSNGIGYYYVKRHFSHFGDGGVYCFRFGRTSGASDETTYWPFYKPTDPNESNQSNISK